MAVTAVPPPPPPNHVAIIMDGNGRWAKQRGLPRVEGHRRGVETVRAITAAARELGVRYLTLYAFSVENWKRPAAEVGALMSLLEFFLKRETAGLVKNRVRLRTIGRTQDLPEVVRKQLDHAIAATAQFTEQTLVLALNYGARTEVLDAARAYAADLAAGKTQPAGDDWSAFSRYLYTADIPDPDLVIRTSGETRISNFLLMQAAYAEFVFTPTLWPDFTKADLEAAIADYHRRERRFGLTSEQVSTPSA
ncbi:MAG: isoprenyl transferase [Opitutaceae bacterium]|nr:isoprenyl transferase [Opitutaceae bacterium]